MGVFTAGGGESFDNLGFTTSLILPDLNRLFVGPHSLFRVRIFFTRADDLLRVQMI